MNVDSFIKLVNALAGLLKVLVWPGVVLFLLIRFSSAIRDFITNIGELSLKGGGIDFTAKRNEAAAALAAAAVAKPGDAISPQSAAQGARKAVEAVAQIATPRTIRRAEQSTILWVDDKPSNNVHERQSLEALGVNFVLAQSTEEALALVKGGAFDLVLSDMNRPPDATAGYTLLDQLRMNGNLTPYIIYAGSRSVESQNEAQRRGAVGCTNRPNELFAMVLKVLGR